MRLIIIGASGLIGRELHKQAVAAGRSVVGTYSDNPREGLVGFDMRASALRNVIPDLGTGDTVFLLSAYSSPAWIHAHPVEARHLNLDATLKLAREVIDAGARLIFMSSVEVFDGTKGDYTESDTPAPLNLYGKLKYEVELALPGLGPRYTIVRTGWNVGWDPEHRCVVKLTYESLLNANARMATDNTFTIADVRDTAAGLFQLAGRPEIHTLHLASQQVLHRHHVADAIIAKSSRGVNMAYSPTLFASIPYSEPRARLNHLNSSFAMKTLGLKFRPASEIIEEKVALLDQAFKPTP